MFYEEAAEPGAELGVELNSEEGNNDNVKN